MNTPKKYMCQVNFNVDGTLLYDSEEELMRLQHRIEDSLLGMFFKVGTSAPTLSDVTFNLLSGSTDAEGPQYLDGI